MRKKPNELSTQIITKAWEDEDFKKKLITNPRKAFQEMGFHVPEGVNVKVVQDDEKNFTFVLPPSPIAKKSMEGLIQKDSPSKGCCYPIDRQTGCPS